MKYLTIFSIYLSICFLHFLHLNPTPELTVRINEKLDINKSLLIIDTKNVRFKQMFDNQKYVQIHKNSFDLSTRQWSNSCYCFTDVSNDWQEDIFPNKEKMTLNQREVMTQNDIENFDNFFSRNFNNPKKIATKLHEKLDNFYLSSKGQDHQEYSNKYNFKYIALINTWHDTVDIKVYDIENHENIVLMKDIKFNGRMAFYYNTEERNSRDLEETFKRFSILTYIGNNPNPLFTILQ